MNQKNTIRIARTVTPPERLPFNEWATALKVSTRVPMTRTKRNIR